MIKDPSWALIGITRDHEGDKIRWDIVPSNRSDELDDDWQDGIVSNYLVSHPVITIAENDGGGFEFTLTNEPSDPTKNILSEEFNLWRKIHSTDVYTGAVKIGMFVEVGHNGWRDRVTEGRITEILPHNDNTVTIRCADFNSILGQQGQSIFRSYIGGRVSDELARGNWNTSAEKLEITVPDEAVVQRAEWGVPTLEELTATTDYHLIYDNSYLTLNPGLKVDETLVDNVTTEFDTTGNVSFVLRRYYSTPSLATKSAKITMEVRVMTNKETYTYSKRLEFVTESGYRFDTVIFSDMIVPSSDYTIDIRFKDLWVSVPSEAWTVRFEVQSNTNSVNVKGSLSGKTSIKSMAGLVYKTATGSQSGTRYTLSSVDGYTISSDLYLERFREMHARISYSTGRVPVSSIQTLLAQAGGYDVQNNTSGDYNPSVREFRVGGGYLLDYMKVLSDISEDGTRCRAFRVHAERLATPVIHFGNRDRQPQLPSFSVAYGDYAGQEGTVRLQMMSHVPAQTMINRPSQIMARTKVQIGDDVLPMMVTVTDWDAETSRNLGTIQYAQGDETSEFADTVSQAWGALRNNNIWEGSATVSGIYTNLIGYSGAGATVAITDPRVGMDGYLAVVKSVVLDYNRQTTMITYGNLGEQYGNKIKDAGNMALFGAGRAVDVGSLDTLYSTQYVRVVSDVPVKVGNVPKHVVKTLYTGSVITDFIPVMVVGSSFKITVRWRTLLGVEGHFVEWFSHPDWITSNDDLQTITADYVPLGTHLIKFKTFYTGKEHIKTLTLFVNPASYVAMNLRLPDAERNGIVNIDDDRVKAIVYPNGDRALISLVVKADPDGYYTTEPNAITQVVYNNTTHLIPEALRPDLYKGQALVVNLDVPVDKS